VLGACLRAFGGVGGIGEGSARAWVLTIVRDTAYRWLHKNRPSAAPAIEDLEDVEAAAAIPRGSQSETRGRRGSRRLTRHHSMWRSRLCLPDTERPWFCATFWGCPIVTSAR
jgi:DNA-directed RNA polymerase specialized sigma24 family protein